MKFPAGREFSLSALKPSRFCFVWQGVAGNSLEPEQGVFRGVAGCLNRASSAFDCRRRECRDLSARIVICVFSTRRARGMAENCGDFRVGVGAASGPRSPVELRKARS